MFQFQYQYLKIDHLEFFLSQSPSFSSDERFVNDAGQFDINKFSKFKHKIVYLKIDKEPENLKYFFENGDKKETKENARINAIKRIAFQRNYIKEGIIDASDDDLILYSDNDEIPNLQNLEFENVKNNLIYFSKILLKSLKDLNSSAFPHGSLKNIVACSPGSPSNLMYGSIMNSTFFSIILLANSLN